MESRFQGFRALRFGSAPFLHADRMWEQKFLQEMSISWTCLHNLPSILSGAPKTRNLRTLPRLSGSDRVHYLSATGIQYAALVSVLSLHLRARTGRRRCCTLAAALDQYEQEPRLHPTRSPEASKPCLTIPDWQSLMQHLSAPHKQPQP